ncbi:hypothetical protein [Pseudohoeflea coraliihabitans]|uniref:GtrA family protein n=1 Tax=Pseudohoeflea coraliihabitans TaxID=2860393 RepID=A0ABS6WQK7_9HYPH|nr:hypothetical protein [Pseudohoeflea sp. DP4N28-3]MBW3097677.1 hypothetical protein [Pseudohoeflea sp. DP4N28-3]
MPHQIDVAPASAASPLSRPPHPANASAARNVLSDLHRPVWIVFTAFVIACVLLSVFSFSDYVGQDNDDVMRLVQVRDLLAGQGWYDLIQYRLGLEGGTLMHWSRLVDLPIALLISLFSVGLEPLQAEAAALFVWPVLTALPLFYALAAGAAGVAAPENRRTTVVLALLAGLLFTLMVSRFQPGGIDHHNVQLVLYAIIAACLVQPGYPARAWRLAGVAAALAIAIGAETTPHVALACAVVAVAWLIAGPAARSATRAFALAMAAALTLVYFVTVPPTAYAFVTCDSLSTGFYSLGVIGAGGLFLVASTLSAKSLPVRAAGLAAVAATTAAAAVLVAPHCLGNPLAGLDPLLETLWLSHVHEAQSAFDLLARDPWRLPGDFMVPVLAFIVLGVRLVQGRAGFADAVLAALIVMSFAIALVQLRGAVFANLPAILVLAPQVARLRARYRRDPSRLSSGFAFAGMALISLPIVWHIAATLVQLAVAQLNGSPMPIDKAAAAEKPALCRSETALKPLASQPVGVVASPSNLGASILRYSPHRVLAAPYHRNQAGMLAQLRIGMSGSGDSLAQLRSAGVTLVAFCAADPETGLLAAEAPDGLYARLLRNDLPAYLQPVGKEAGSPLRLFAVVTPPVPR